jgi:hypothetical protein
MKRLDYVKYDEQSIANQELFKRHCEKLVFAIEMLNEGRAKSLALTKLEECYMWIGKALRDSQIERNGSSELL